MARLKDWLLGVERDKTNALYADPTVAQRVRSWDDALISYLEYKEYEDINARHRDEHATQRDMVLRDTGC